MFKRKGESGSEREAIHVDEGLDQNLVPILARRNERSGLGNQFIDGYSVQLLQIKTNKATGTMSTAPSQHEASSLILQRCTICKPSFEQPSVGCKVPRTFVRLTMIVRSV